MKFKMLVFGLVAVSLTACVSIPQSTAPSTELTSNKDLKINKTITNDEIVPTHSVALPEYDGHPILIFINGMCVVQNPSNRQTPFGEWVEQLPTFRGWETVENSAGGKCAAGKTYIPQTLCKSALQVPMNDEAATEKWLQAHATAIQKLKPILKAALSGDMANGDCP